MPSCINYIIGTGVDSVFPAPPGAKVSDVQSGRPVDLCQVQFWKKVVVQGCVFRVLSSVLSVL